MSEEQILTCFCGREVTLYHYLSNKGASGFRGICPDCGQFWWRVDSSQPYLEACCDEANILDNYRQPEVKVMLDTLKR